MTEATTAKTAAPETGTVKKTTKPAAKKPAAAKTTKTAKPKAAAAKTPVKAQDVNFLDNLRSQFEAQIEAIRERIEALTGKVDLEALKDVRDDAEKALAEARDAAVAGARDVNTGVLDFAQANVNDGIKAAKAVVAAQSFQEVVDIQSAYARSALETYTAQLKELRELATNAIKATVEPVSNTAKGTFDKIRDRDAA